MSPLDLLKAPHIGIRELRNNLSAVIGRKKMAVVTDRGRPMEVLLPYETMLSLLTLLGDLVNSEMTGVVRRGQKAIKAGSKGVPARARLEKYLKA